MKSQFPDKMNSQLMLSLFVTACLLSTISPASVNRNNTFKCNPDPIRIIGDSGLLIVTRDVNQCGFKTPDNTQFFAIKTDNLILQRGEEFRVETIESNHTYQPPFDAGYFITGLKEPAIIFTLNNMKDNVTQMELEFFLKVSDKAIADFDINGDINNYIHITPLQLPFLTLRLNKTITDLLHLQLTGATIANTSSRHKLIAEQKDSIPIKTEANQVFRVETSPAYKNCSNSYSDNSEQSYEITGPDASSLNRGYKCVNIFSFVMKQVPDSAHYEANFNNFLGFADSGDRLTLDDGSPDTSLNIINSETNRYIGEVLSFKGTNLAVVYESPLINKPSKVQFKLTVQAKLSGGIVDHDGYLNFSDSGKAHFVLKPRFQEFAAIELPNKFKFQDANLTISKGSKIIAVFTDNTLLPPVIALDEPDVPMILDFHAKSYKKLSKSIKFISLKSSCHRITPSVTGSFSVVPGQGPCYWTVASDENVAVTIDSSNFNGSLSIQPLFQDKPIYSNCCVEQSDVLPTFILRQAYINVTLKSNNSRFDASLSTSPLQAITELGANSEVEFSSPGYPVSYDWSSERQTFLLNATGKNYVLSIGDADLRVGEKILVANSEALISNNSKPNDVVLSNKTVANITIARSISTNDFDHHRGFKLKATQFDTIIIADLSKNKVLVTPKNITSLYLKISASDSDKKSQFTKRISYNITASNDVKTGTLSVIDGGSLLGRSIVGDKYRNASTSDTLIITYRVDKPSTVLPELTISYDTIACNRTSDHICDNETRCVPFGMLCKGISFCNDASDLKLACTSGPAPKPSIIETGVGGMTVFILCVLMLILGAASALYGPDLIKTLETRFRSGQYTTFTSTE